MKRYNYFDDEPVQSSAISGNLLLQKGKAAAEDVRALLQAVFRDNALRELPLLRRRLLRLALAFAAVLLLLLFFLLVFHTITARTEKNEAFCASAAVVCTEYIREYGAVKWDLLDEETYGENRARLTGLCYVRQMDFNNDGTDELMLCYYDKGVYYLEIWGYKGKDFARLHRCEANSTVKETDGVWISFYRHGGKYYICTAEPETPEAVTLYGLHGDSFTAERQQWTYDVETASFSRNGKTNTADFETIQLAVFRRSRAEILVDTVTANLDSFGNLSSMAITETKSKQEQQAQAYYEVVKKRIDRYGAAEIETEDGYSYIDGVALVRLLDFDRDADEELLVVYRKYLTKNRYDNYSGQYVDYQVPVYSMDVYDFTGTDARRIFSKECISNCLEDEHENVFYLLLRPGEKAIDLYTNNYSFENSYCYTATSKIYRFDGERFVSRYTAKLINEYGYRQYFIDNERVYSSTFAEEGYRVPFFLDDEDTVDTEAFDLIYLSGRQEKSYAAIIEETNETIRTLNPDYEP